MKKSVHVKDNSIIPNFFDFIESDTEIIFGNRGVFAIFNIYNLTHINENSGTDLGDVCIEVICETINKVRLSSDNTYGFRFGNNDFIMIMPNSNKKDIDKLILNIESEFSLSMQKIGYTEAEIRNSVLEYSSPFYDVVDFYEFLFFNLSVDENSITPRRLLRHIIGTFTRNIKNTLDSYLEAKGLAHVDDISGLSNNRAGKIYLAGLIREYTLKSKGFCVMFIDGDNLKRYNQVSYESGNQMIRYLSQIITNSIRDEDKVYRWLSGDEFIVVANEIDKDDAYYLAERVRKEVEEQTRNCLYPTTISIGVSHYPSDGSTMDEVIGNAEKANKDAKDKGKNSVVCWNAETL